MKRFVVFFAFLGLLITSANAAVPQQRRGQAAAEEGTTAATSSRTNAVSARSATTARSATSTRTTAPARSATTGRTTVSRSATPASTAPATTGVVARAGTTQKVISTGTKVASATENVIVSEACRQKYMGCMDSFCMLDNDNGGRCICSDKNAELDTVLAEIEKLDQQSYQMATVGVERIEMGDAADAAIANANAVAESILKAGQEEQKRTLDLSLWNMNVDEEDEEDDIFGENASNNPIEGKEGDALYQAANDICVAQVPECQSELSMLQLMYSQQIKSDCSAYENSLKQQKNSSAQKLYAAEQALRSAALEQYQSANKYDLGQCAVEFKNCMITTAGCGDDFSKCASVAAFDNTNASQRANRKPATYTIQGTVTGIEIYASTYDTLLAKKPLCEGVTKSCVAVADKVWDTFLKDIAPQIKSAELIAENDARQNCIGSISDCFQKACKDNIDPNDPDGSYDMCLTRPETMLNLCKVPLNACGIDASSVAKAEESQIWDFVVARLASMRVDSCTTAVKECLQADDRCGKDYTQCIGLDLASIRQMCPLEKLVACQQNGELTSMVDIDYMLQGIYLGIDNAMLEQCQNIVNEKMLSLCGDLTSCDIFSQDANIGKNSLVSYKNSSGDYVIDGVILYSNLTLGQNSNGQYNLDINKYMSQIADANDESKERIRTALTGIQNEIQRRIDILASDPEITMCVSGRDMSQIRGVTSRNVVDRTTARFPHLLDSYTNVIANAVLDSAKSNYDAQYANLFAQAISTADEYKNQIYCNALVQGEEYASTRLANKNSGIKESNDWSVIINGVTDDEMLNVLLESKGVEKVIVESKGLFSGRMIGKQTITGIYEPGTSTCRITTTTYPCTGFEAIYNYKSASYSGEVGAQVGPFGGSAGYSQSKASDTYQGNFCSTYAEPVITEQLVSFAVGSQQSFGLTTRSNLQSYYNDQSSVSNVTEKNGGGFSLGISTGDISNIGNSGSSSSASPVSTKSTSSGSSSNTSTGGGSSTLSQPSLESSNPYGRRTLGQSKGFGS